jgi:Spy/CpxP family protein refolding chaperone
MDEQKPVDPVDPAAIPAATGPGKRRKFFKRLGIATLIGGIAAGIGFKAFAHGAHGCHARGGFMAGNLDPAQMDQKLDRMLKHLYVEIDATEEQKQKLAPIVKQAARDLAPLRGKMQSARTEALAVLTRDGVDRAAIESLRAGQIEQADAASKRLTQALADVAEVLTPAQRKQIAARVEKHRRGWMHG